MSVLERRRFLVVWPESQPMRTTGTEGAAYGMRTSLVKKRAADNLLRGHGAPTSGKLACRAALRLKPDRSKRSAPCARAANACSQEKPHRHLLQRAGQVFSGVRVRQAVGFSAVRLDAHFGSSEAFKKPKGPPENPQKPSAGLPAPGWQRQQQFRVFPPPGRHVDSGAWKWLNWVISSRKRISLGPGLGSRGGGVLIKAQ